MAKRHGFFLLFSASSRNIGHSKMLSLQAYYVRPFSDSIQMTQKSAESSDRQRHEKDYMVEYF